MTEHVIEDMSRASKTHLSIDNDVGRCFFFSRDQEVIRRTGFFFFSTVFDIPSYCEHNDIRDREFLAHNRITRELDVQCNMNKWNWQGRI